MVIVLTGMGFAGFKFVLIGELALNFKHTVHQPLPIAWMEQIVINAKAKDTIKDAITQALAAVLTGGVLLGYLINAPLAGAWRVARLFVLSSAGVAAGTLMTLWLNPWLVTIFIGISYGTACAARGKLVPLVAKATGNSNTKISGYANAALVISLLAGTVFGVLLFKHIEDSRLRHVILFLFVIVATMLGLLVNPPEPPPVPFRDGMRDLLSGTVLLLKERWAMLVAGGMAWGIAAATVLAVFMDAVERLRLTPDHAVCLVVFPAAGAILGNLLSHHIDRRRHVIGSLVLFGASIFLYPVIVQGFASASAFMVFIGIFFSAPTNVLDARLLAYAAAQGNPGRGATVMSLVHNVLILIIGTSLAILLFLGEMSPVGQFKYLGGLCLACALVVIKTRLKEPSLEHSVSGLGIAAPSGAPALQNH